MTFGLKHLRGPRNVPAPSGWLNPKKGVYSLMDDRLSLWGLSLGLFLFWSGFFPSLAQAASTDTIQAFASNVKKFTLNNGMRVIVYERPDSPTVSFAMFIRTGAIDDESGKSGMAHMFEHMFFKGTKTIGTKDFKAEEKIMKQLDRLEGQLIEETDKGPKGNPGIIKDLKAKILELEAEQATYIVEDEYWRIYERAGGQGLNASTGFDFTNYVVSLPANKVELWMAMESDRVRHPVLREFYKERDVVREERRQRVDNSPNGKLWEGFLAAAFMAHPYGRPIVGWDSDLAHLTRMDAERFFNKHYGVNRLVVAVAGGIKSEEVERLAKKYFEGGKSSGERGSSGDKDGFPIGAFGNDGAALSDHISVEPPQAGERRVAVEYDAEASLLIGFHRPNHLHPDNAALEMLSDILEAGRTSRLYKNIVQKKKIASSIWASASTPGERDPNVFVIGGTPLAPNTLKDLEKAIYKEIERIKTKGPKEQELVKVRNNLEKGLIDGLSSNSGLANQLAYFEAVAGNWEELLSLIKGIQNVTEIDVQRVAEKYLIPSNRTVAWIEKKSGGEK